MCRPVDLAAHVDQYDFFVVFSLLDMLITAGMQMWLLRIR